MISNFIKDYFFPNTKDYIKECRARLTVNRSVSISIYIVSIKNTALSLTNQSPVLFLTKCGIAVTISPFGHTQPNEMINREKFILFITTIRLGINYTPKRLVGNRHADFNYSITDPLFYFSLHGINYRLASAIA